MGWRGSGVMELVPRPRCRFSGRGGK